jgi:hypothetical protein
LPDELARAPIAVARHDQMRALRQHREERRRRRAHARREEHSVVAALEIGELALDGAPGRIAVATVLVAREPTFLVRAHLFGRAERVRRRLVDRNGERVGLAELALSAVYRSRGVAVGRGFDGCVRRRSPLVGHLGVTRERALSSGARGPEPRGACKRRKSPRDLLESTSTTASSRSTAR